VEKIVTLTATFITPPFSKLPTSETKLPDEDLLVRKAPMNRIDRLFGILLQLQAKKRVHSKELATAFEVSERTIFRDIAALTELGVPITTEWGEGYALLEGFYLPPLIFTPDEASSLSLGARMLVRQAAGKLADAGQQAIAKLEAILPKDVREQVEELADTIRFLLPERRFDLEDKRLMALRQAIKRQQVIDITYHSYSRDEVTQRQVEPYELIYAGGSWYVRGHCRLRQDTREFRLERIDGLRLIEETFARHHLQASSQGYEVVQIRVAGETRRWIGEYQNYAFQHEEILPDGSVIMTYHPHYALEMKPWLLMWGAQVNILTPLSLRVAVREEALRLAEILA
jgi:predicted DNA-binding transcriptional regulator YafY